MPNSNEKIYDVVILGGGPAGSSAGMTLLQRPGLQVLMLEQSTYNSFRVGESLSPGVRPVLDYLGVWDQFRATNALDAFGTRAAWGSEDLGAMDYLFTIHGSGWNLDRLQFDRMLAKAFEERGGTLRLGHRFLSASRGPDHWTLLVSDPNGEEHAVQARFVIDATGRNSRFVRSQGVERTYYDRLVGIGMVGDLEEGTELESVVQVEASEFGWWYTAPVPGGKIAAVFMTDADLASQLGVADLVEWQNLLQSMPHSKKRTLGAHFEGKPRAFASFSSSIRETGGNGWVAVGDAAVSHDPLSSSGIPHALGGGTQGAILAANSLFGLGKNNPEQQKQALAAHHKGVADNYHQYLKTRWQYYAREKRWPNSRFWKRRQTSVSLDPFKKISSKVQENHSFQNDIPSVHLPEHKMEHLHKLAKGGMQAHEVVRAFALQYPGFSDERIILGLQDLVATGWLQLEAASD